MELPEIEIVNNEVWVTLGQYVLYGGKYIDIANVSQVSLEDYKKKLESQKERLVENFKK